MHAYPIPDRNTPQVTNSRLVERPLYVDRGSHTFGRMAKDDHETVALRLDHLAMMAPHIVLNYAVVSLEQIYPLIVSEPLGDLPGAWREVPESSCGVVQPGEDEIRPFTPIRG